MNIYVAASLFSLLILTYWVMSEVFTIMFRFVGLPEEKARFQVVSILTGCGFTTRESEMILSTKPRRRIARILMLFGYVFNISVVSAFVNVFFSISTSQFGDFYLSALIPIAMVALLFGLSRMHSVRAFFDRILERFAGAFSKTDKYNPIMLIDHIGKGTIAQVTLNDVPERIRHIELRQTGLREKHGILIMLIEHPNSQVDVPTAHTVLEQNDRITVFGDYKTLCRIFNAKERFA